MDGKWRDYAREDGSKASTLHVGPIFSGEVYFETDEKGAFWRTVLNGQKLAGYPSMERAKARIDWEIWNRLRLTADSYKKVLARHASWEKGSG